MTAVTLGPAGTYSHRAAAAVADDVVFAETVTAVVEAVADENRERGVVPVENSIEGGVDETLDALAARDVAVVEEVVTPIRHALLGTGGPLNAVASHPQALAQCRSFLAEAYPDAERRAVASTAAGIDAAREEDGVAAIAHPDAAGDGVDVLARDVQDRASNATRFLVLAPPGERGDDGTKTSLVVYPNANHPGLLVSLLEPFAERGLNLTRIESRPSGEHLGDYVFHVDVAAGAADPAMREALAAVETVAADGWVRRIGSYDVREVE